MLLSILILLPTLGAVLLWALFRTDFRRFLAFSQLLSAAELLLALAAAIFSPQPSYISQLPGPSILPLTLTLSGFGRIYIVVIAFMWLITLLLSGDYFTGHHKCCRYLFFTLLTLGATMGVFLADDLMTAFIFFEVMSFTSFPWVIQEETPAAIRAAGTYLGIAVIGGLTALMGLFLLQHELGTFSLNALQDAVHVSAHPGTVYAAGICLLVGFGAKAGMFPLHVWLPKAHPVAPAPASALLSGILTKAGVFGVIVLCCRIFSGDAIWGTAILLLGCVTMLLGAVLALFSVDLKRTLACSSLSQIGFVLLGCAMLSLLGTENTLAARGTLLHMLNHSLFKLLLFLCAGVIYMNAHTLDLTKLRGFGKDKPFLMLCFLLGAAGISGIPGLNGYISKTLLHESITEGISLLRQGQLPMSAGLSAFLSWALPATEWIFLISGGLTFAYMLKLFLCLFVEKPEGSTACTGFHGTYLGPLSRIGLAAAALPLPLLGLTAPLTMTALSGLGGDFFLQESTPFRFSYYSLTCLKGSLISLAIGGLIYLLIVRLFMIRDRQYVDRWPARLDLEERIYRPLLLNVLPTAFGSLSSLFAENVLTGRLALFLFRFFGILARAFCDLSDALILLLRHTLFQPNRRPDTDKVHLTLSYRLGLLFDRLDGKPKDRESHRHAQLFYRAMHTIQQTTHGLTDSVSFGLLMLTGALCVILIYVLFLRG